MAAETVLMPGRNKTRELPVHSSKRMRMKRTYHKTVRRQKIMPSSREEVQDTNYELKAVKDFKYIWEAF